MSDLEDDNDYLGDLDDPDDVDAPAYYDRDGHALAGKTFFNPREKNHPSHQAPM